MSKMRSLHRHIINLLFYVEDSLVGEQAFLIIKIAVLKDFMQMLKPEEFQ